MPRFCGAYNIFQQPARKRLSVICYLLFALCYCCPLSASYYPPFVIQKGREQTSGRCDGLDKSSAERRCGGEQ